MSPSSTPALTSCFFRLHYSTGTVLLEFVNRDADCTTIQKAVEGATPPLGGQTVPLSDINRGSSGPACYRGKVVLGGVNLAQVLAIYQDGADTSTASSFCRAFVGPSPPN